ncbi:neutral zinc metallopeptidase [soil metagenome]
MLIGALSYAGTCQGTSTQDPSHLAGAPAAGQDDQTAFVGYVLDDVQKTFAKDVPNYLPARLEVFRRAIKTECGTATSAVGPFYCPKDEKAYIDLAFYDDLRQQLGAPGDFAQAYVIAHELGHHVQNLRGEFHGGGSIAIELQADCFAGAWAKDAETRGLLEVGDIDEALNAAAQIGDDTLQKKSQGYVQPETWTHGSAAQRSGSFKQGYSGGFHACDSIVAGR